jgi:hypothetical protein
MSELDTRSTLELEQSLEADNADSQTVSWDTPTKQLGGVRDPGSKAFATGFAFVIVSIWFQFDLPYKQGVILGATLVSGLIAAYGPALGRIVLEWRHERLEKRVLKQLRNLAQDYPDDPDIEEKGRIARKIIVAGLVERLSRHSPAEKTKAAKHTILSAAKQSDGVKSTRPQ